MARTFGGDAVQNFACYVTAFYVLVFFMVTDVSVLKSWKNDFIAFADFMLI